ncbi:MAG TPA: hypothetical protein VMA83_11390 [Solirubrobacteraceae bacterium]|nr:hypothetical protein [Solirubrobacteraceae bacterium]
MTIRKTLFGLISVAALLGVFATTAIAQEPGAFEAQLKRPGKYISEEKPAPIKATNVGPQEFQMSFFRFTCAKATGSHTKIGFAYSNTFYAEVRFTQCWTYFKVQNGNLLGPYRATLQPIDFEYHWNGFAEFGGESESNVRLVDPGEVYVKIGSTQCEIYWEPQTIPSKAIKQPEGEYSSAVYSTTEVTPSAKEQKFFGDELQKQLVVSSDLKSIKSYAEGGRCENFKKEETSNGYYKGTIQYKVPNGDLGFYQPYQAEEEAAEEAPTEE